MNTNTQREIDLASREKIIHNINKNFFVEAGAGSGKTTVLVERMVAMIEAGVDISKISAITFTKAAANEFYARFQKRLIERSNEETHPDFVYSPVSLDNPTDLTRNRCKVALQNIDLAFMGTIDSFCNMIMSEHPAEGLIPTDASVISNEEAEEIYKREYANILNGKYNNPDLEEKGRRFKHYFDHDADSFIAILKLLLVQRDCRIVIPSDFISDLDVLFAEEKKTISKIINVLADDFNINLFKMTDKNLEPLIKNIKTYKSSFHANRSWENNISGLLTAFNKIFEDKNFRLHLDKPVEDALGYAIDYFEVGELRNKPAYYKPSERLLSIPQKIRSFKYQIALEFAEAAKEEILKVLRSEGKLTFNDYLIYLRDTLKDDAAKEGKLIKHIYERHKYFMIDEFQDTDPVQSEIFFYLTAKEIKKDWRDSIPHPGSLFIVGDPKQSIYRFKNADVASFLRIRSMFEKDEVGEVLYLFCNFRSTYEIRTYFNETFNDLFVLSADQAAYPLIPLDEIEKREEFTGVFQYEFIKDIKDNERVADIILRLVNNPKYYIKEKKTVDGKAVFTDRPLKWKDFMLITSSKAKLADYTSYFRMKGIPYFVEGNINFNECRAFKELVKVYGGITLLNDNRCFYSALKSELFNVTSKDLIEAKTNKYDISIKTDISSISLNENLKNAVLKLQALASKAVNLTPSSLFIYLIENLDIFKKCGNKNMEYLYFALELLKAKESANEIINHVDAYNMFLKLLSKVSEQERCPGLTKDGNQVHLANLHKVKGLERPIVILANPNGKAPSKPDFRMVRQSPENLGYVFNVSKRLDSGNSYSIISTEDYAELKELETESVKAEKIRTEYVAATRARNVLIMASRKKATGEQYSTNPWIHLFKDEYQDIDVLLKNEPDAKTSKNSIDENELKETDCIIKNDILADPSYTVKNPSSIENDRSYKTEAVYIDDENGVSLKEGDTLATALGTMVHRLMELLINSKDHFEKEKVINTVLNELLNNVNKFNDYDFYKILSSVYETMHNGGYKQINGAEDNIFSVLLNAQEVYTEVPFTYKENNNVINGIIDCLYKKDNEYHIIDWKTNKNNEGLAKHYKSQLDAYKSAVFKSSKIDVKDALIYHIDLHK